MMRQTEHQSKESLWDVPALGHRPKFCKNRDVCHGTTACFPTAAPLLPLNTWDFIWQDGLQGLWHFCAPKGSCFPRHLGKFLTAYMVAKGFSSLTTLALLMTLLVMIPNYGTGTTQTMQFLSVQKKPTHTFSKCLQN